MFIWFTHILLHKSCKFVTLGDKDLISNDLNSDNNSVGVFLDLTKAFDTLDHTIH